MGGGRVGRGEGRRGYSGKFCQAIFFSGRGSREREVPGGRDPAVRTNEDKRR